MSDLRNKISSVVSGPSTAGIKRECDEDPRDSEDSKVRLKTALVYCEQLLLENNYIATEPSAVMKREDIQMGEEIYRAILRVLAENTPSDELITCEEHDEEGMFEEVGGSSLESDDDYEPDEKQAKRDAEYIPLEHKIKVVNMVKEHPKWSLKTIQKRGGSRLKRMDQLKVWEEQIRSGGTMMDKYNTIDSVTYDRFVEARRSGQQVLTKNLQEWALAAASRLPNLDFRASDTWVEDFKRRHRIRHKKVTKFEEKTVIMEESLDVV